MTSPVHEEVMAGLRAMLDEPSAKKIERDRRAGDAVLWRYSLLLDAYAREVLAKHIAAAIRGTHG